MLLDLERRWLTAKSTIGQLCVEGALECFVLEDFYREPGRPKVTGKTCIPCGRYPVSIVRSPRFGIDMPRLLHVPGFEGVLIHPGNTPDDTEGCLLPGRTRGIDVVNDSRLAYGPLFRKLQAARACGEEVFIEVRLGKG
jgi:hypothetical protein